MHELAVTESILRIVLAHADRQHAERVLAVNLRVGELSSLEAPWIQRYFDRLSKNSIADGARLRIDTVPVTLACGNCGLRFSIDIRASAEIRCPACNAAEASLVSGHEYRVESIEVV
jgi:hydrogenase nickel incorporation protein HypA/HybF